MRKQAKSWLIKFLIGIISLVFVFYFGYSFSSKRIAKMAYVNGELISRLDYEKEYKDMIDGLQRQYGAAWNDDLIKALDLKNRALQNIINRKLISQEAERLGFQVTRQEVQNTIMEYPAFQVAGRFDVRRYQAVLDQNRMKPEDFENNISQELLQKKLRQFVLSFTPVTDKELTDDYTLSHEQVQLGYLQIKPGQFTSSVKVEEAPMAAFFKEHREDYRVPEKIKLVYLTIDPADYENQVKLSDHEIKEYYQFNLDTYKVKKQVCASHILFKLKEGASKEEEARVKEKAEKVLKMAREGKDFATLAKTYSEGPTKANGGDLGCFPAGNMVKPFEDAAFKLKKGEISDLVKTRFGYHIILAKDVKEARVKPLEEVRSQIVATLKKEQTSEIAHEKGLSLTDQMPYEVDLSKYGPENHMAVTETGFFSKKDPIPGLGGDEKIRESLFSLGKNEASELTEINGKFYIFQVAERKASYLPEMAKVSDAVRKDFINLLALRKAKSIAEKYLVALKKGSDWKKIAEESGATPGTTGFFTRRGPVPEIGNDPDLIEAAFHLNDKNRYPDRIFEHASGALLIRWEAHKGIDKTVFEKEKKAYRFSLMRLKQSTAYQSWLDALRRKAKVEILVPVS